VISGNMLFGLFSLYNYSFFLLSLLPSLEALLKSALACGYLTSSISPLEHLESFLGSPNQSSFGLLLGALLNPIHLVFLEHKMKDTPKVMQDAASSDELSWFMLVLVFYFILFL